MVDDDVQSSIPSVVDGLTQVQRTILICAFKNPYLLKVEDFCDYVSQHSLYPYEKEILETTMTGLVQNYAGSNNVNLLCPSGVGTNYMHTALSPKTRHLFRELDEPLRKYLSEDVKSIEPPPWLMPIIPMVLVNGSVGPKYDPQDIIDNIIRLLHRKKLKPMIPSYKWFKGKVRRKTETSYTTFGVVEKRDDAPNSLFITELPIGKKAEEYEDFLKAAVALPGKEAFIKEYIAHHYYDGTVTFEVVMLSPDQMKKKDKEEIQKMLGLTTDLNTNNMHLLGPDGKIKKYDSPEEIGSA